MNRLSEIRKIRGYSQKDLAEAINVGQSGISHYEKGIRLMDQDIINRLCDVLETTPNELLGTDNLRSVPILGKIKAGMPVEACQQNLGNVVYSTLRDDLYGLVVCGESMNEFISSGGIVICEPFHGDLLAVNNKVVHAEKNGGAIDNDATLKRYMHSVGVLVPDSNTIDPETNEPFESYRMEDGWQIKGVVIKKLEDV